MCKINKLILLLIFTISSIIQATNFNGICVGINDYPPGPGDDLNYCVNDANGIRYGLIYDQGWSSSNVELLTNSDASKTGIQTAIQNMPRTSGNTDLMSFSGHGDSQELGGSDGLIPSNSWSARITQTELQSWFGSSYNQYCTFLDACGSGIFPRDMSKGVITSACRANESASERPALENGIYSYYVIKGLDDNNADPDDYVSAEDVFNYASYRTTYYNSLQHPQIGDNYSGDLDITVPVLISPSSRNVTEYSGSTTFTIENDGDNSRDWTVTDNASWVTVSPASGTLQPSQNQVITINYGQNIMNAQRTCVINVNIAPNVTLVQAEHPATLSGSLSQNEIWTGNLTLSGDVTVPSGKNLTLLAGSKVTFPDYKEMYVYGTLTAEGTSSNKIIFESQSHTPNNSENAYLVRFNNSSGSSLDYCKFQYAYRGIYSYNSTPDITNCEIRKCYYGIYNNNSNLTFHDNNINNCYYGVYNYYSHPDIRDNEIDVSSYGIYNYRSSPNIYSNDIEGGAFGMRCASYSSPQMCGYTVPGYNQIHDNFMFGVYCENNSNPFMGSAYCVMHGYNSLTNNEEGQVSAGSNCSVIAEENWWGSANPSSSWFSGDVDYIPYLSSPPSGGKQKSPEDEDFDIAFENVSKNIDGGIVMSFYDPTWNLKQKTRFAHALIYNGDPQNAQTICKDIIANYPDSSLAFFALDLLWQASRKPNMTTGYNMTAFKDYLLTLTNRQDKKLLYGSAALLLAGFKKEQGLSQIDYVFNNYRNTYLAETSLFQKFMYYLNDKEDNTSARNIVNEMDKLFPNSSYTIQAHHILGDKVNWGKSSLAKTTVNQQTTENTNLPEKYELLGAFPNPFNPSTNINYELPRLSRVEISIFNMLGQKVKNLKILSQNGGVHKMTWDGTNSLGNRIPSGIYVVHFKAVSLEGKDEIYEKSLKVTLIK